MNIARKAAVAFLASLLSLLLLLTAIDFGLNRTVGNPGSVKGILNTSGLYSTVVKNALDQAKSDSGGGIPLNDPAVQTAAEKALSPAVIRGYSNQIIDSIYKWLDGKTSQPDFSLDLSGPKAVFADGVGQAAQTRAAGLPTCATYTSFDSSAVFSASCIPRGVSAAQVGQEAKQSILDSQNFLANPVISADSLKDKNKQSAFSTNLKNVPRDYQWAKRLPYLLALLALLAAVGIYFASASRKRGLRRVGICLAGVGILLLIVAWALGYVVNHQVLPKMDTQNSLVAANAKPLIRTTAHTLGGNYWFFGGLYVVLAVAALAGPVIYNKYYVKQPAPGVKKTAIPPETKTK